MIDENAIAIGAKVVDIATDESFWSTAKDLAGSPKLIWSFLTLQHFYGRAREINARNESREEYTIVEREHKAVKKHIKEYLNCIESKLWHGITEYEQRKYSNREYKIVVKKGNSTVGISVEKFIDGYHTAYGKEIRNLGAWIYEKVSDELEGFTTGAEREEFVKKYAEQFRVAFFDTVHKRSGYNSEISDLENSVTDYLYFVDVIESVLTFAEKRRSIRIKEEEDMLKKYNINVLSVVKIFRTLFGKRKRKRDAR